MHQDVVDVYTCSRHSKNSNSFILKVYTKIQPCSSLRQIKLSCVLDYHDVHYSIENMHVPHCVISVDYFGGLYIL